MPNSVILGHAIRTDIDRSIVYDFLIVIHIVIIGLFRIVSEINGYFAGKIANSSHPRVSVAPDEGIPV